MISSLYAMKPTLLPVVPARAPSVSSVPSGDALRFSGFKHVEMPLGLDPFPCDLQNVRVFSGPASTKLAESVVKHLGVQAGQMEFTTFADGTHSSNLKENVRGKHAIVIQSVAPPVADNMMKLCNLVNNLKKHAASRVTVIMPYDGYSRADGETEHKRECNMAALTAKFIHVAGADEIVTFDLHSKQIAGYFDIPVNNVPVRPLLVRYAKENLALLNTKLVNPDEGAVKRNRPLAEELDLDTAIICKERVGTNVAKAMGMVGEVKGNGLFVDDILDTFGSLKTGGEMVKEQGGQDLYAFCAHGLFSGPAAQRIKESPFKEIIVTDSITLPPAIKRLKQVTQITLAPLIAEIIRQVSSNGSIKDLTQRLGLENAKLAKK